MNIGGGLRWQLWCKQPSTRAASTASLAQHVKVTRTGGRHIDLDIYEPTRSGHHGVPPRRSFVLFFSRGPLLRDRESDDSTIRALQAGLTTSHIVHVRAGLGGKTHCFPQPVFDALAAFDWSVSNILPERSIKRQGRASHIGQIATCGELVGGGLAAMLALTECKVGQAGICAAAINNPIVDWIDLDDEPKSKSSKSTKEISPASIGLLDELRTARGKLFARERDQLDAFASPILFFRSAGLTEVSETDEQVLQSEMADTLGRMFTRTARHSHQFPNRALQLKLPAFNISTGNEEPLRRQGIELVKQLRMSVIRQRRPRRTKEVEDYWIHDHDAEDVQRESRSAEQEAEASILHSSRDGIGLWDDTPEGQASLQRAVHWLHGRLDSSQI